MKVSCINIMKQFFRKIFCVEIVAFIFVFLLQFVPVLFTEPLIQSVGGDEVGTISGAAFFAGYDWSETVSLHKYYGFGYSVFMAPLFEIFKGPKYIYQAMIAVNGITYASSAAIAANCMKRFCNSSLYVCLSAIACVFIPLKFTCVINEHMLILLIWIVCWVLLQLNNIKCDNLSKKNFYTVLLAILLAYSLTIHTRAILIWGAVIVAILYEYIHKRKFIVNVVLFLLALFLGYIIANSLIEYVQNTLYTIGDSEVLANSSDMLTEQLIKNPKYSTINIYSVLAMIASAFSMLFTGGFVTAGVLILGLIIGLVKAISVVGYKKNQTYSYMVIYVFAIAGLLASLLGQVILWMPDMQLVEKGSEIGYILGGRVKFYLRYYICYAGPVLMCLFCVLANLEYKKLKNFFVATGGVLLVGTAFMTLCVAPYFIDIPVESSPTYYILKFSADLFHYTVISRRGVAASFLIAFALFIFFWFAYKKKRLIYSVAILMLWLVFQCGYICLKVDMPNSEKIYAENGKLSQAVELVSDEIDNILYIPVKQDKEYRLQFYLYEYKFRYELPEKFSENTLVMIRNSDLKDIDLPDECYYISDNNWGLYFSSEVMKNIFFENGYEIEKYSTIY